MSDHTAWLIERVSTNGKNMWLAAEGCYKWSIPNLAVQFCGKRDAEAVIQMLDLQDCFASEHSWVDTAPPAPPVASEGYVMVPVDCRKVESLRLRLIECLHGDFDTSNSSPVDLWNDLLSVARPQGKP
jgi:hypothetical protein